MNYTNFHKKIETPMDLTASALESVCRVLIQPVEYKDLSLIVRQTEAFVAGKLAERYGVGNVIILPDEIMEVDSWAVIYNGELVWSPGA